MKTTEAPRKLGSGGRVNYGELPKERFPCGRHEMRRAQRRLSPPLHSVGDVFPDLDEGEGEEGPLGGGVSCNEMDRSPPNNCVTPPTEGGVRLPFFSCCGQRSKKTSRSRQRSRRRQEQTVVEKSPPLKARSRRPQPEVANHRRATCRSFQVLVDSCSRLFNIVKTEREREEERRGGSVAHLPSHVMYDLSVFY